MSFDRPASQAALASARPATALPRALALLLLLGLGTATLPDAARAHGRSVSYSSWEIDGREATVRVRLRLLDLSGLGPDVLRRRDRSRPGAGPVPEDAFARRLLEELVLRIWRKVRCHDRKMMLTMIKWYKRSCQSTRLIHFPRLA